MSNCIVKLPSVESFGRLTPDKWLAMKNLEESAELVSVSPTKKWHRRWTTVWNAIGKEVGCEHHQQ